MKRLGSRRVRWVCGLTAIALALISLLANSVQTVHDKQKVAKMTEKMKTRCVGRFLIDLPAEAHVTFRHGAVGGLDIVSDDRESDAQFAERLRQTERELASAVNDEGAPSLETNQPLAVDAGRGATFVYNRRRTKVLKDDGFVVSENLALLGMLRFENVSITGDIEWVAPRHLDSVAGILKRLRPIPPDEIPRESGFCLGHVIARDPYQHDSLESVVMFAGLPGHPDVNIVLSSMVDTVRSPGLLERNATATAREPMFMQMAFTHLREHARTVQGLQGEELVMRVREANFTTGYSFQWEMPGKDRDVFAPRLKLELESGVNPVAGGNPVQSTLSEEAMFALWERLVGSIRLRPTEVEKTAASEPAEVPLGVGAFAGETCPQTGWWRCTDAGNGVAVLGGQRQFMKAGQPMPQALLLPRQTLWQRVRGVQPGYESTQATLWQLSDKRDRQRAASSVGVAPGALIAQVPAVDAGAAQVGSVVGTGAACPSSGWWRCVDGDALDGTRWFAAGSALPPATFRSPAPGRRLSSSRLLHRRTAWRLVRVTDGPDDAGVTTAPHERLDPAAESS